MPELEAWVSVVLKCLPLPVLMSPGQKATAGSWSGQVSDCLPGLGLCLVFGSLRQMAGSGGPEADTEGPGPMCRMIE